MSSSSALQTAIYAELIADSGVTALVGTRVVDGNKGTLAYPYLSFGPTTVIEDDADCIAGRVEVVQIDIWSQRNGQKLEAKQIADAVKACLHRTELDLGVHGLHSLRLDLARILDDPDGITAHGVMQFQAIVEEDV